MRGSREVSAGRSQEATAGTGFWTRREPFTRSWAGQGVLSRSLSSCSTVSGYLNFPLSLGRDLAKNGDRSKAHEGINRGLGEKPAPRLES